MFGESMSQLERKNIQFDRNIAVCNSFRGKILNDQLCYEIYPGQIINKEHVEKDLNLGLSFIMDYNEDRQMEFEKENNRLETGSWKDVTIDGSNDDAEALIYLNTIGNENLSNKMIIKI